MTDTAKVEPISDSVVAAFESGLNRHGFAFQQAVIRKAEELFQSGRSKWCLEPVEFPVAIGGSETHIDFILRSTIRDVFQHGVPNNFTYLVCECKRVDPAYSKWFFAKAPYSGNTSRHNYFIAECISEQGVFETPVKSIGVTLSSSENCYHIWFDAKTDSQKGDGTGALGKVMKDAPKQVFLGVNGLAAHFAAAWPPNRQPDRLRRAIIIPVIFTTAELFATQFDIASANLSTGKIVLPPHEIKPVKWLRLQHVQSRSLRGQIGDSYLDHSLTHTILTQYARSIFVVNVSGIEDFLLTFGFHWEDMQEFPKRM